MLFHQNCKCNHTFWLKKYKKDKNNDLALTTIIGKTPNIFDKKLNLLHPIIYLPKVNQKF